MPTGLYPRTEEYCKKMSFIMLSLCRKSHGITRGRRKYWAQVLKERVKFFEKLV